MISIQPTIPGGASATVATDPQITLVSSYNKGQTIDGQHYVIAPAGLKVTGSTPAPGTVAGRAGHGIQADLQQADTPTQALDEGITYSAGAALDTADVYRSGSCIVKVRSSDPLDNLGRAGLFDGITALHVVSAAPASGAIAPVVWPSASLASRPWRVADLDAFLADLPSYTGSGAPAWSALAAYFDKLDFGRAWSRNVNYQYLTPRRINGTDSAYDESRAAMVATVWAGMCSDAWSAADKEAAAIRVLSNGCQIAEAYQAFGFAMGEDGGHFQSHLADCLAWLKYTGRTGQYATVIPLIGGNVLGQYYQVTAGQFAPHSTTTGPYIARRRTVSAITGSGPFVVTCTGYRPGSGLTEDTASNANFTQLNMVRETNSAVSLITAQSTSGANWDFTVATLPTGLSVSDTIYCAEVSAMAVGTAEWTVRNLATYPNLANPSPNAEYRSNNKHGSVLSPMSVIGMRGADFDDAVSYLGRVPAATSYGALEASVLGTTNTFARDFWSTHQATALAMTQVV